MTNITNVISAIDTFIDSRLDMIIGGNPLLNLAQPFIKRAVKKQVSDYTDKIKQYAQYVADKDGNIDVDNIFDEVTKRFNEMDSVIVPTENMGNVTVGKGELVFEVPSLFGGKSKKLTFTTDDIMDFKSMIINKNGSN